MRNTLMLENSIFPADAPAARSLDEAFRPNFGAVSRTPSESRADDPSTREILLKAFAYTMTFVLGLGWATAFPVRTRTVEATQIVKQCPDGMVCLKSVVLDESVRQAMLTARAMAGIGE